MGQTQSGLTWGVCFCRICLPIGSGHKIFDDKTGDKMGELLFSLITEPQASPSHNKMGRRTSGQPHTVTKIFKPLQNQNKLINTPPNRSALDKYHPLIALFFLFLA
jgi:hypothetical protein